MLLRLNSQVLATGCVETMMKPKEKESGALALCRVIGYLKEECTFRWENFSNNSQALISDTGALKK